MQVGGVGVGFDDGRTVANNDALLQLMLSARFPVVAVVAAAAASEECSIAGRRAAVAVAAVARHATGDVILCLPRSMLYGYQMV